MEQASIDYDDEEDGEYEVSGISDEDHRRYSNDEIQLPPSRRPSGQNRRKRAGYRDGQRRRISRDPGPYNSQQRHYQTYSRGGSSRRSRDQMSRGRDDDEEDGRKNRLASKQRQRRTRKQVESNASSNKDLHTRN